MAEEGHFGPRFDSDFFLLDPEWAQEEERLVRGDRRAATADLRQDDRRIGKPVERTGFRMRGYLAPDQLGAQVAHPTYLRRRPRELSTEDGQCATEALIAHLR